MSVGSGQLLRHRAEPILLIVAFLILVDLAVLGAATLGAKGGLLLGALAIFVWIAFHAEWAMALMMVGYALVVPPALLAQQGGLVPLALRALALVALGLALIGRKKGSLADFVSRGLRHPLFWLAVGLAAVLWVGTLYTAAPRYGAGKAMGFTVTGLFYVVMLAVLGWLWGYEQGELRGPRRFMAATWSFLCFMAILAVLNIFLHFDEYENRLSIPGLGPIWLGRMAGMGILMVPYAVRRLRWPVSVVGVMALCFAVTLVACGSRGPIFVLVVTILAAIVDRWLRREGRRDARRDGWILAGSVAVGVVVLFALPEQVTGRLLTVGGGEFFMEGFSWKARILYWGAALLLIPQAGLIGLGTGGFAEAIFRQDYRFYPHNILAELYLENGLPGLILLLLFVVIAWRVAPKLRSKAEVAPEAGLALFLGLFAFGNALVSGDIPVNEGIWVWGGFLGGLSLVVSILGQRNDGDQEGDGGGGGREDH